VGTSSPENPNRVRSLYVTLQQNGYAERCSAFPPREATTEQVRMVHSAFYLDQIREHAVKDDPYSYDKDTYLMEDSLPTARLAAGGCLELADRIMEGDIDYGFGLIRPPGHHASSGRGMGFCILNNVSLVAQYLRKTYGLHRILIVDFDVHHANGTQEIFYDTNEVLVLSIHQRGMFPFSGEPRELGEEAGIGYSLNVPVHPQFGDSEYTFLLGRLLQVLCEQYMPQIILVSAGYDGHIDDTISQTRLSTRWFGTIAHLLRWHVREICDNRLLFILEGGYNPASLEASVLATLDALLTREISQVGIFHIDRAAKLLADHPGRTFWTI
jgi:acetoin utilization deacetylase AcuC-like enzyme